ncbi:MAG: hypothetical protein J0I79_34745 [Mesorhizobium sp.]|uniref:hypothetical protein n=1 Tax=Mesorhizobium sp. TaxID=1871066 RepID=UPI001ACE829B|nr:hypothetical protein [Mesorhizobium sp.]MBN9223114.1 hypothetical protein [Mesorhizobium sp.]
MSGRTPHRQGLGILESTAVVLAVAVASLAMARAYTGPREREPAMAYGREAAPERAGPDAADMLLHD